MTARDAPISVRGPIKLTLGRSTLSSRNMKRQTSTKKEMSTEPFGTLELYGVVPCSQACGKVKTQKLGSKADGTFHTGRSHRLQY
ncbi:unnamed protein product [Caenorhabditis sp. 36 PRJEB53466]|nr:unnamed protein product [Caenorhabditis sp. 36 PRJEB53466]